MERTPEPAPTRCLGSRLLDEWVREDSLGVTPACEHLAARCGVSVALVHAWRRTPAAERHRQTIEEHAGVPAGAWLESEAEERPTTPEPDLPPLEGSAQQRLRTLESWLEQLTRAGIGLSTDRNRAVSALLLSLQGQVRAKPIPDLADHPEWDRAIEMILEAVAMLPGGPEAVLRALQSC